MSVIDVRNPGTGELLGQIEAMSAEQVAAAVDRAQQGQREMAAMPSYDRAAMLQQAAASIASELDSLAILLAATMPSLCARTPMSPVLQRRWCSAGWPAGTVRYVAL